MKILDIYVTKYRRDSLKFLIRWIPVCRTNNLIKITTGTVNQKRFTVFLCLKVKISYRKSAHKYKKVLNKTLSDETFLIIWRCFFVPLNKCGIKFYPYTNFGANTIGCEKSSCLLLFRARVLRSDSRGTKWQKMRKQILKN